MIDDGTEVVIAGGDQSAAEVDGVVPVEVLDVAEVAGPHLLVEGRHLARKLPLLTLQLHVLRRRPDLGGLARAERSQELAHAAADQSGKPLAGHDGRRPTMKPHEPPLLPWGNRPADRL